METDFVGFCRPLKEFSGRMLLHFLLPQYISDQEEKEVRKGEGPGILERAGIGIILKAVSFRRQQEIDDQSR